MTAQAKSPDGQLDSAGGSMKSPAMDRDPSGRQKLGLRIEGVARRTPRGQAIKGQEGNAGEAIHTRECATISEGDQVQTAPESPAKGVKIMTPDEYAAAMKVPVAVVKKMLCASGRTEHQFDARDVDRRFGRKNVRLIVTDPTVTGFVRPRVVSRKAKA